MGSSQAGMRASEVVPDGSMSLSDKDVEVLCRSRTRVGSCNSSELKILSLEETAEEEKTKQEASIGILYSSQLLSQVPSLDFFSAPIAPLRTEVTVPFKWEEAPGKPKPCTDLAPCNLLSSLQLPPRLLYPSDNNQIAPDFRRSQSWKSNFILSAWSWSPRAHRDFGRPNASIKKVGCGRIEDPSSPTSTLFGPEGVKRGPSSSTTSDSSSSVPDLRSVPSSRSSDSRSAMGGNESEGESRYTGGKCRRHNLSFQGFGSSDKVSSMGQALRKHASESMKSLLLLWQMGTKWKYTRNRWKKRFKETEVWSPTLATYFHSMELARGSSVSEQILLLGDSRGNSAPPSPQQKDAEMKVADEAAIGVSRDLGLNDSKIVKEKAMALQGSSRVMGDASSACCLPPASLAVTTRENARRGRRWVGTKLRRSSRLFAAIWRFLRRSMCGKKLCSMRRRRQPPPQQQQQNETGSYVNLHAT